MLTESREAENRKGSERDRKRAEREESRKGSIAQNISTRGTAVQIVAAHTAQQHTQHNSAPSAATTRG
jgi:hypothetical protein